MGTWLRRNLLWLLILPVALVTVVAASSQRYWDVYREEPLRIELARAEAGEPVSVRQTYATEDGPDAGTRDYSVELVGVEEVDEIDEYGELVPLPHGVAGQQVTLRFEAPRSSDLSSCDVIVVDTDGNRYGDNGVDPIYAFDLCARTEDDVPEHRLPEEWEISPVVATPPGTEISEVWLAFESPEYVALPVP